VNAKVRLPTDYQGGYRRDWAKITLNGKIDPTSFYDINRLQIKTQVDATHQFTPIEMSLASLVYSAYSGRVNKPNIADAATKIVEVLMPFQSDERRRAVSAALLLLGESSEGIPRAASERESPAADGLPGRVQAWLRQNGLEGEHLDQVFHRNGDEVEVIASEIPGTSDKERTLNAYLLAGASRFLATGDAAFGDQVARCLCKGLGFYNEGNHAAYMKSKGNRMTGSKAQGWTLTAPGLTQAAHLIKQMTSAA
jgi:hypothetical protein